jgi:eight-cysteine-cluster-containing protein
MITVLLPLFVAACNHPGNPDAAPDDEAVPAAVNAVAVTPGALYARCRDRVEGPEAEGECVTDADCARTGCSSEVCTTVALAPEIMTTCEVLPCFGALQACGCHEGRCTWTIAEVLPGLPMPRIPREIPPRVE